MTKGKGSSKKQQKRGIDFKKVQRKLGRRLPPPKNATNTEIKSKAIILPQQSVVSEKEGLAVNKKGLTLKELFQQTSHHNAKVRKDALMGMKDLFLKYPEELKLHKYAVIEKLCERISDEDKIVRETLYQLLKSVVLPGCKEDNQGLLISLMMAFIFNATTHLAIDVRLMAFKFLDLILQQFPSSFSVYAEKILQNYEDILQKNQSYLHDKGKLKSVLAGLAHCLSLLPSNNKEVESPLKDVCQREALHAFKRDVQIRSAEFSVGIEKLKDLVPVLVICFHDFIPSAHNMPLLDAQSFDCMCNILRSIKLAVRFLVYGIGCIDHESQPLNKGHDTTKWDQVVSLVLLKKLIGSFPLRPMHQLSQKDDDQCLMLNIAITEIFLHLSQRISPSSDLMEKFLSFIEYVLLGKICEGKWFGKAVLEQQILTLLTFIPKLMSQLVSTLKYRLLQAFTKAFQDCNPDSSVKLACLTAIEEMLISKERIQHRDVGDSVLVEHQIAWIRELPRLLILLGDEHPSSSLVILRLLLHLGQCSPVNSLLAFEYDNTQYLLQEFYSTCQEEAGGVQYGPFIRLPRDAQELSVCCLYYFSHLEAPLLRSIVSCCLYHELDPFVLFRIVEVLHVAYESGHIQIADYISFFITLLSRFKVFPESNAKISNHETFKLITSMISTCLSGIGDKSLVFQIVERALIDQISLKPLLDNACAMLRVLLVLDSKPTRLSEQSIITLSSFLSGYLMDVVLCGPERNGATTACTCMNTRRYYILPSFFFFDRSKKILSQVLNIMGSFITESISSLLSGDHNGLAKHHLNKIDAIASVLQLMREDFKVQHMLTSMRAEIEMISHSVHSLQISREINMPLDERHRLCCAFDQIKSVTSSLPLRTNA
ncbi:hypothetical protein K2173_011950 [Erythroxylum novogranatense]|uniref:Pre-rRNA-processing protein Ipi1 N-terminal domain-containing protein n=1 Tax=Erythroxylum novogranatense TaxID=1862640 RepID=A0AAV8U9R0_9ROSI|nr:hypothetical protein K2173_011950 [Erythroxylum novogranatense]